MSEYVRLEIKHGRKFHIYKCDICGKETTYFTKADKAKHTCGTCQKERIRVKEAERRSEKEKQFRNDIINEIDKLLLDRFTCDDLRTDWTNADIRETIHFELEQLKEDISND